jgi:two-component system alkaline phosphatase synthesis response regulator PhoP
MGKKILLIEDDPTMQTLLQTYLQFEGFDVVVLHTEENLEQITGAIRVEKPDLVLLDVYLRHLNGFDLLSAIRQDPQAKQVGVIMSSGIDFSERCLEEGADSFILKPYMPEELIQSIRKVIAKDGDTK